MLDPAGLTLRAELPDTEEGRSVYMAIKRGDLTGMSFGFKYQKAVAIMILKQIPGQ